MEKIVEQFVNQYQREYDYYYQAAKICSTQVENRLESSGIRAMVTFRSKRSDKLYEKLIKRDKDKAYKTIEDIYDDIVDLAGVRIALYFPGDQTEVDKIIQNQFEIVKDKEFPTKSSKIRIDKTFAGYKAKHYRVKLKNENLVNSEKRFSKALIEIQVASVLMHGWAEVEHDLVYKPLNGSLSQDELAILDELNGLVLTGEIALERLQRALKRRVEIDDKQFNNHFELAAYIYDVFKIDNPNINLDNSIGKVDLLFRFVKAIKFNKPEKIKKYICKVVFAEDERPISEQIIDSILIENSKFYEIFEKVKFNFIERKQLKSNIQDISSEPDYQTLLGKFLSSWILLENTLKQELKSKTTDNKQFKPWILLIGRYLIENNILNEQEYKKFELLRRFRNNLIHGLETPDHQTFQSAIEILESLSNKIIRKEKQKKKN